MVREKGSFRIGKNINLQILINQDLNNSIGVGYIATKKIGKAFKRNKARRIMKELAKKILIKGKINSYFVLIAKPSLLETPFEELVRELEDKIKSGEIPEFSNPNKVPALKDTWMESKTSNIPCSSHISLKPFRQ